MGKKLAIRGHSTRGKEVIKLLEMMGGSNIHQYNGEANTYSYYVSSNVILNDRLSIIEDDDFEIFTLDEFLKKYPFKVGNKVTNGFDFYTIKSMSWSADYQTMVYDFEDSVIVLTAEDIKSVDDNKLSGTVDNSAETKSCTVSLKAIEDSIDSVQFIQSGKIVAVRFNTQNYENEVELQLDDYEIVVRDGKTYAVRKKSAYPKTYKECCKVLRISPEFLIKYSVDGNDTEGDAPLIKKFIKLKRCRDAYWRIAGEQMGLGKPWKPDWTELDQLKYCIWVDVGEFITMTNVRGQHILAFPTEEMRDAFYENFKELIEQCKELL